MVGGRFDFAFPLRTLALLALVGLSASAARGQYATTGTAAPPAGAPGAVPDGTAASRALPPGYSPPAGPVPQAGPPPAAPQGPVAPDVVEVRVEGNKTV